MTKILITGSTTGLGLLTAKALVAAGNDVVCHARNQKRAAAVKQELPQASAVVVGDLSSMPAIVGLVKQINDLGPFDTIIHNAGVYTQEPQLTFQVNVLAPYILTALVQRPQRLIYLSSGMHVGSRLDLAHLTTKTDYSSSKLQVLILSKAIARLGPTVVSTSVDPGWVPTRMGGSAASDDLTLGYTTQVWLATLADANVSGNYYHHVSPAHYDQRGDDVALQTALLAQLAKITGVTLK